MAANAMSNDFQRYTDTEGLGARARHPKRCPRCPNRCCGQCCFGCVLFVALLVCVLAMLLHCPPSGQYPPKFTGVPPQFNAFATNHVLVFGGDGLLGLAFVQAAVHQLPPSTIFTLANRGHEHFDSSEVLASLGPRVQHVACDRDVLDRCALELRHHNYTWLIDFSARSQRDVTNVAIELAGHVQHSILISSGVVYTPFVVPWRLFSKEPFTEALVLPPEGRSWWQHTVLGFDQYMSGKMGTEDAAFADRSRHEEGRNWADAVCTTVVRLPFVIGRRDNTNRLAQLLLLAEADEVQISGASDQPISFVDADTVASALIHIMMLDGMHVSTATSKGSPRPLPACSEVINIAQPALSLMTLLSAAEVGVKNLTHSNATAPPGPYSPPSRVWWPGTAAESLYKGVAYASVLPFKEATGRLEALGWRAPWSFEDAAADAAKFVQSRVLQNTTFTRERASLVSGLPAGVSGSARLIRVLRRYGLPISKLPPAEKSCGYCLLLNVGLPITLLLVVIATVLWWRYGEKEWLLVRCCGCLRDTRPVMPMAALVEPNMSQTMSAAD